MSAAEDFAQYKLHFVDDIQHDYEVIRPIVLFAETIAERSRQTGIERPVVGTKARRFAMEGMLGLVDQRLVNPGGKGHVYPEAVAALQKSLSLKPSGPAYSNLGTILYFLGRYDEAVPNMAKAVELVPARYTFWGNYGDACRWSSSSRDKAPP